MRYLRWHEVFRLACFCLISIPWSWVYASADSVPLLRINDPFAGAIWRIDADTAEDHLVSGSADEAVTVWALDSVEKPKIHRVPPRPREQQRAHAVAVSPDGSITAYSVPPLRDENGGPVPGTSTIFVLNTFNGEILEEIGGIPNRPQDIAFSPDGDFLAAAISDGCGVRVWSTKDWRLFGLDDAGYAGEQRTEDNPCLSATPAERDSLPDTLSLAFPGHADIWLVTSGYTGIRTYRKVANGIERILHRGPDFIGVERPDGIALSPDGRKLAVGDRRFRGQTGRVSLQVMILDLATLEPVGEPLRVAEKDLAFPDYLDPAANPAADQFNLARVVWGEIGSAEWVIAGGTFSCVLAKSDLRIGKVEHRWREVCAVGWRLDQGKAQTRFFPIGSDQVMDLKILPRRQWVLVASQKQIAALNPEANLQPIKVRDTRYGKSDALPTFFLRNRIADFRDRVGGQGSTLAFRISEDAKTVFFEDYRSTASDPISLQFDLQGLNLTRADAGPTGLHPPNRDELLIERHQAWRNGRRPPRVYRRALRVPGSGPDIYRAVTLFGDRQAIILSASFIRVVDYRRDEPRIRCQRRIAAEGYRVNVTPDGKLAVVGHGDGTLRWYRIDSEEDGNCLLTPLLSVHLREVEGSPGEWVWIAWRPSTGDFAMDARAEGLVVWQLTDRGCNTRVVPFGDLTFDFYDRSAVESALEEPRDRSARSGQLWKTLDAFCDPIKLRVDAPKKKGSVENDIVRFRLTVSGESHWPRRLLVTLGDATRVVKHRAGKTFGPDEPVEISGPGTFQLDVDLPRSARERRGDFHLCFHLDLSRHCHPLVWRGPLWKPDRRRLWALLVGISKYGTGSTPHRLDLRYAQNDVLDLAKLFIGDYQRSVDPSRQTSARRPPLGSESLISGGTPEVAAISATDYDEIQVDLIVAPSFRSDAEYELGELGSLPYVRVYKPTAEGLREAIAVAVDKIRGEWSRNDLFLFYFSGHGLASFGGSKGHSLFLLPDTDGAGALQSLAAQAIQSQELLDALGQVTTEMLVVFDACRDVFVDPRATPFDPGKIRSEFETRVPYAHFFFSADAGQRSAEQNRFVFDQTRRNRFRGNGLFTYALLKSLTDPKADFALPVYAPGKIQVEEVKAYVAQFFSELVEEGVDQEPVFVPSRTGTSTIVRSLEGAESQ